ncbi:hypothetical protein N9B21_00985 [Verrucomicrobiales bacterium]|jgi:hypothetical protein|nr:hypothetical protein [Verrucomicrobiales bacterium]MDA7926593.1 hypothetical protein [Verrucomicrobiales bacterium]|tara:strand:+ start:1364 stop:1567 length:204 start_codon:yes stop_codon:yes gene_type:complete
MATHNNSDEPLKELKHDAVPGYLKAFVIAFAVMGLYLAILLIATPGPAKGHHGHDDGKKSHATEGKH